MAKTGTMPSNRSNKRCISYLFTLPKGWNWFRSFFVTFVFSAMPWSFAIFSKACTLILSSCTTFSASLMLLSVNENGWTSSPIPCRLSWYSDCACLACSSVFSAVSLLTLRLKNLNPVTFFETLPSAPEISFWRRLSHRTKTGRNGNHWCRPGKRH